MAEQAAEDRFTRGDEAQIICPVASSIYSRLLRQIIPIKRLSFSEKIVNFYENIVHFMRNKG